MDTEERYLEAAEAVATRQQQDAVARIQAGLGVPGADECCDCGGEIGAERRRALPSAKRCIGCQISVETRGEREYRA